MGRLKTAGLNLDDRAVNAWMALYNVLWKLKLAPQYYETSIGLRMLTKLQNNKDLQELFDQLERSKDADRGI